MITRKLLKSLPPGSEEARAQACICDATKLRFTRHIIEAACPVHGSTELLVFLEDVRKEYA